MNKKGAEKVLSVYWFAIIIIVAGGIVAMVYNFHSYPYDVREIEAGILSNSVADCISRGGILNPSVFENSFSDNFLDICNIDFGDGLEQEYFVRVEIYDSTGNNEVRFSKGNLNLLSSCGFEEEMEAENIAKCVQNEFLSTNFEGNLKSIKLTSIIRKIDENVKK